MNSSTKISYLDVLNTVLSGLLTTKNGHSKNKIAVIMDVSQGFYFVD